MNCLDKMYREIESILEKEREEEALKVAMQSKTFSKPIKKQRENVDYISKIVLPENAVKKYFEKEKAKIFVEFIFNKFYVFNKAELPIEDFEKFKAFLKEILLSDENVVDILKKAEDKFVEMLENLSVSQELLSEYFTNVYHGLFEDEKGYYAVIIGNKYSNIQRPIGMNANYAKKIIKEEMDALADSFRGAFKNEKELNAFLNKIKSKINKFEGDAETLQTECENDFSELAVKRGISKSDFEYAKTRLGFSLVKQGNLYFKENGLNEFNEYKKIEFRY